MTRNKRIQVLALLAGVAAILIAYVGWFGPSNESGSWKSVDLYGTRFQVPSNWEHQTGLNEVCEEQWAPPGTTTCATAGIEGVGYQGPQVDGFLAPQDGIVPTDGPGWQAVADAGNDALLYVSGPDRDRVDQILKSVRPAS